LSGKSRTYNHGTYQGNGQSDQHHTVSFGIEPVQPSGHQIFAERGVGLGVSSLMSRRRDLKAIASGIAGSFISRNNDVGGYWAMGLLCELVRQMKVSDITLELENPELSRPTAALVYTVADVYQKLLHSMLDRRGLDPNMVRRAYISVEFGTSGHLPLPPLTTWGAPFLCTVGITDDLGRERSVAMAGRCGPHDPRKESRRVRIEAL